MTAKETETKQVERISTRLIYSNRISRFRADQYGCPWTKSFMDAKPLKSNGMWDARRYIACFSFFFPGCCRNGPIFICYRPLLTRAPSTVSTHLAAARAPPLTAGSSSHGWGRLSIVYGPFRPYLLGTRVVPRQSVLASHTDRNHLLSLYMEFSPAPV